MDKLIIAPGTDPDQFYATGLKLHSPFITLCRGKQRWLAAAGFEYPQAATKYSADRFEDLGKTSAAVVKAFLKKHNVKQPLMPASTKARTFSLVRGAKIADEIFPERAVKRKDEVAKIRAVQRATEDAITAVRSVLSESKIIAGKAKHYGSWLTSEFLKRTAAVELAKHNCCCPDMIISSGSQTKLPHHEGSGIIREGAVVVDVFPKSNESLYYSDCTRTFVVGSAPKSFEERHKAVLEVHKRMSKALRHGAYNVEKTAKRVFDERGFATDYKRGIGYIHSLGHGVGLDIHESPRLSGVLKVGNVITIEPGLYYDYGIRVEDIGLVTKTGFNNFVKLDKNPYL